MNHSRSSRQNDAWQLHMFQRSLKKRLKLRALLEMVGELSPSDDCLLLTCGDNNGALNYYFRSHGGQWMWGDAAGENLQEVAAFLGEPVHAVAHDSFPFNDASFDCVVAIDVLEHLRDELPFLQEVRRVLRPDGRAVVTVPNGDATLLANRLRWRLGMKPEIYGHFRAGYNIAELSTVLARAGLVPMASGGYSRFFTEIVELFINYGYVFLLSRRKIDSQPGHIAPTTSRELKQHGAAYRIYQLTFPLMSLISGLDRFLPASGNGAVIVVARRNGAS